MRKMDAMTFLKEKWMETELNVEWKITSSLKRPLLTLMASYLAWPKACTSLVLSFTSDKLKMGIASNSPKQTNTNLWYFDQIWFSIIFLKISKTVYITWGRRRWSTPRHFSMPWNSSWINLRTESSQVLIYIFFNSAWKMMKNLSHNGMWFILLLNPRALLSTLLYSESYEPCTDWISIFFSQTCERGEKYHNIL